MITTIINRSGKELSIINNDIKFVISPQTNIELDLDYKASLKLSVNEPSYLRTGKKKKTTTFLSYQFTVTSVFSFANQKESADTLVIELFCFEKTGGFGSREWYTFVEPKSNSISFLLNSFFIEDKNSVFNEVLKNDENLVEIRNKYKKGNNDKMLVFMHTIFSAVPMSAFVLFVLSGHIKKSALLIIILSIWLIVWLISYFSNKCYDLIIGSFKKKDKNNNESNNKDTAEYNITERRFTSEHIKEVYLNDCRKEIL